MEPVNLFNLATQQSRWLSVRQSAVAGNIANANTPGYSALDVEPFSKVLDNTRVSMKATQASHISGGATADAIAVRPNEARSATATDNNVQLEQELMRAGEVRRAFELNTAIVKSFHRMIMNTTRT